MYKVTSPIILTALGVRSLQSLRAIACYSHQHTFKTQ